MTPDELKAYLEVIKGSGVPFGRLEIHGKLTLVAPGAADEDRGAPDKHPAIEAIEELFPNGIQIPRRTGV